MKYLLVALALLGSLTSTQAQAQAQTQPSLKLPKLQRGWTNPLPMDSTTGKVSFKAVVQAPGVSQAELYARAKKWFADAPSASKQPLLTADAAGGKLVGKTSELMMQNILGANVQVPMWRTITIQVKPGRFRYQITDFAFDSGVGQAAVTPLENYIAPNALTFDEAGYPKPVLQSTIDAVQRSARQQAASIRQSVSGKGTDDNW